MKCTFNRLQVIDIKTGLLVFIILFSQVSNVLSQEQKANNSVYIELGGNGLYYSVNYERILLRTGFANYALRGGMSFFKMNTNRNIFSWPLELNVIFGQKKSHIEFAPGYTLIHESELGENHFGSILFLRIGYRYQKSTKGFIFRVGFTPYTDFLIDFWDTPQLSLWGGISVGYAF